LDGKALFFFLALFLFSFPSLASIPGDFNFDGKVDFKDLMLFAMHYGEEETTGPVHNLNQGTYYATIQEAIDAANSGDTIEVSEGTYYENIVFDGKNITVQSINPLDPDIVSETTIDGKKTIL